MRALQLVGPGKVELRDVPVPDIAADEVLVKVAGAGVCHSDLHLLHWPDWPVYPMTVGHESTGHVAAVGADVAHLDEGDAVLVFPFQSCGACRACIEGRENVCVTAGRSSDVASYGLGLDGGMADYIAVKARDLHRLGDLDPVVAAPLSDAGLTPMHAINGARHRLTPGSTAVVLGVGGLGHMGLQILKATTAARLIAVESDPAKLDLASKLGADVTVPSDADAATAILDLTGGYGADAVFDFVGVQPTVDLATRIVAPDGALRFVGLGGGSFTYATDLETVPLPWGVDVRRSLGGTRTDQDQVIALAALGRLTPEVTRYSLDDGIQAFRDLEAGTVPGRAVLVP